MRGEISKEGEVVKLDRCYSEVCSICGKKSWIVYGRYVTSPYKWEDFCEECGVAEAI